ncbi:MAG: RluA family pseudouridine synthase [Candidatus Paceibacterota bacterium]
MTPQIIYKDKNFLAVNKPAGLLVHPAQSKTEPTLADLLVKRYPEIKKVGDEPKIRPGIVHRLDKDTSGVILIPRNQDYFNYLKKLFQERKIKKTYLALVWGKLKPKIGIIKKQISLKTGTTKRTVWKGGLTKEAVTEYKVLKYFKFPRESVFTLLRVSPKTGRTHQIRVHLASIGHPIVGDSLYGPKGNPFNLSRQFLHAESLEFNTADGKRIKIEADLPRELRDLKF